MFGEKTLIGNDLMTLFPQLPFKVKEKKDHQKDNPHDIQFEYRMNEQV